MENERQVETNIPQRLDRLPWSSWHLKMVVALGITWLLDGLEVTLAGSFGGYILGALLMILGAGTEWKLGINAERQSLESISTPLQASGKGH